MSELFCTSPSLLGRRLFSFALSSVHKRFKRILTEAVDDLSSMETFDGWREI